MAAAAAATTTAQAHLTRASLRAEVGVQVTRALYSGVFCHARRRRRRCLVPSDEFIMKPSSPTYVCLTCVCSKSRCCRASFRCRINTMLARALIVLCSGSPNSRDHMREINTTRAARTTQHRKRMSVDMNASKVICLRNVCVLRPPIGARNLTLFGARAHVTPDFAATRALSLSIS